MLLSIFLCSYCILYIFCILCVYYIIYMYKFFIKYVLCYFLHSDSFSSIFWKSLCKIDIFPKIVYQIHQGSYLDLEFSLWKGFFYILHYLSYLNGFIEICYAYKIHQFHVYKLIILVTLPSCVTINIYQF